MRENPALFQISQRADYIQNDFFEWVQHNRAIINTRDEPLADPRLFRRLHLIHGDSNVLPQTLFLKVGTTRLVLDLLDADDLPEVALHDAVTSLRALSRNLRPPWHVTLADGRSANALELLDLFYQKSREHFQDRDDETNDLLALWEEVLDHLATDPLALVGTIDWVSKEYLFREFCAQEGLEWGHTWLESQDLEFHQIHPKRSLGMAMVKPTELWSPSVLRQCMTKPPPNSRASMRSRLMREIMDKECSYFLDWEAVELGNDQRIRMLDPFQS
jgi:proteasome accessory factor A